MNHPHDDDDVAHLQRLAYGADSTPEERQRAVDDLRTLAIAADAPASLSPAADAADLTGPTDRAGRPRGASAPAGSGTASATAAAGPAPASDDEPGAGRRLAIRIGVVTGAAALVVGVLAGWQLARLDGADAADAGAPPATSPGPRLQADVLAAMPVATETLAARVFLREPVAEDAPGLPGLLDGTGLTPDGGPPEFRLLAVRADGTRFFAARDGDELCLFTFFSTPEPSTTRVCTRDGRFPNEGLRLSASAESGRDSVDATWRPDGSLQIGTLTGAPPGE